MWDRNVLGAVRSEKIGYLDAAVAAFSANSVAVLSI
jgi:hypothetical protein